MCVWASRHVGWPRIPRTRTSPRSAARARSGRAHCNAVVRAGERCTVPIQTNNLKVDDRGWMDIVDRANIGLHRIGATCGTESGQSAVSAR